jgi:hypothetical protein
MAYILRAEKTDAAGESHNDGKYVFYLSVTDMDIKPKEDAHPVRTLRMRYDALKSGTSILRGPKFVFLPWHAELSGSLACRIPEPC